MITDEYRRTGDAPGMLVIPGVLVEQADPEVAGLSSGVTEVIEDIKAGRMVVVLEGEDRESQGILAMAAEKVTPQAINFMITHAGGLIGVSLPPERLDQLHIPMMVPENEAPEGTLPLGVPAISTG